MLYTALKCVIFFLPSVKCRIDKKCFCLWYFILSISCVFYCSKFMLNRNDRNFDITLRHGNRQCLLRKCVISSTLTVGQWRFNQLWNQSILERVVPSFPDKNRPLRCASCLIKLTQLWTTDTPWDALLPGINAPLINMASHSLWRTLWV